MATSAKLGGAFFYGSDLTLTAVRVHLSALANCRTESPYIFKTVPLHLLDCIQVLMVKGFPDVHQSVQRQNGSRIIPVR